jgi:hypothetical protein
MRCTYDSSTLTCRRCGHVAKRLPTFRNCPAVPQRARARLPRVAAGDLVERMLTSVGITQELVQRLTRTTDCGCKARQRWLNQWGFRQQDRMERLLNKAARWYGIS